MGRLQAVAVGVLGGCYGPTIHGGEPCATDQQCPHELMCIAGVCGGPGAPDDALVKKDAFHFHYDAAYLDAPGTHSIDAPLPPDGGPAACANFDLGSSLGAVTTGSTVGHANSYMSCNGQMSPDVSYAWTAPATAQFTIDLCNSPEQYWDSVLYVRDGSCSGMQLACDDDGCPTSLLSRVRLGLTAGQLVVIVVDGFFDAGRFTLTITQN